jgi:hypothetical protein
MQKPIWREAAPSITKAISKRAFEDAQKACQLGEQEACARTESLKQRI